MGIKYNVWERILSTLQHLVLSLALLVSLIPIVSPVHIRPATPHHRTQTGEIALQFFESIVIGCLTIPQTVCTN